jgi:hypothetical protein
VAPCWGGEEVWEAGGEGVEVRCGVGLEGLEGLRGGEGWFRGVDFEISIVLVVGWLEKGREEGQRVD